MTRSHNLENSANLEYFENIAVHNQRSLKTLTRAIEMGRGKFSLIVVRCNYESLQEQILQLVRERSPREIENFLVPQSAISLYRTIKEYLGDKSPDALMVLGLESIKSLELLLQSANRLRDRFRNFSFPIVLWLTYRGLQKLMEQSPDFNSFASAPIRFYLPDTELKALIFKQIDSALNDADNFYIKPTEIEAIRQDLPSQKSVLDEDIEAGFAFLMAWDLARNNKIEPALNKYQESLLFWRQTNNLEMRSLVLLHLGIACQKKGKDSWQVARDYFQESLQSFELANREDLAAKYLGKLEELLINLPDWESLKNLAKKAIQLHENYGFKREIAIDYAWLAEEALHESRLEEAGEFAEKALKISAPNLTVKDRAWFWFILGQSLAELGKLQKAIAPLETASINLETARKRNPSEYDAKLHVKILKKLRNWQFLEKQYLPAFRNKLLQRKIETQQGWRAFVGPGKLQPPARNWADRSAQKTAEEKSEIARQIVTNSGRQNDIECLVERIKDPKYKITVIHGQSGVGKSSILKAGLIPALQLTYFEGRDYLPVLVSVYKNWIQSLGQELVEVLNIDSVEFSPNWILSQLRENEHRRRLSILIFDQFEEFFFDNPDPKSRAKFYQFLQDCLTIPYLKVILSLREDYLYYLLEFGRLAKLKIDKNYEDILYYLGNFNREDAWRAIISLSQRSQFNLESDLVAALVEDLDRQFDGVRPIELQVVGMQLESDKITTLEQYQQLGQQPKEILVERFLEDTIKDCGKENEKAAELVLYLLTNEKNTRPLKTRRELKEDLENVEIEAKKLNLVLEVLVGSGLVLMQPDMPENFYKLVHDYLVPFIRKQRSARLASQLRVTQAELRRRLEQARVGIVVLVVLLVNVVGFGITAELQRRRAEIAEIKSETIILSWQAQALLSSNNQLDALVVSVQAGKKLQEKLKNIPQNQWSVETIENLQRFISEVRERNRLRRHKNSVVSVAFSPNGRFLASGDQDNTIKLWSGDGKFIKDLGNHNGDVWSVSFSPDGKILASAGGDGIIKLWSLDGILIQEIKAHAEAVTGVSFSPDSEMLVSGSEDKTVKLWRREGTSFKEFKTLTGHDKFINNVAFSPDGEIFASAGSDNKVILWRRDGTLFKILTGHEGEVWDVSFSPDGEMIASASFDETVKLWNRDGVLLKILSLSTGHTNRVLSVSFSPDGRTIASASLDQTVILWHRDGTRINTLRGHTKGVRDVSFHPDAQILASASLDKTIRLWEYDNYLVKTLPEDGEETGHQKQILQIAFNSDGRIIASASRDGTVKLWSPSGQLLNTLSMPGGAVNSVRFSFYGEILASASEDGTIQLWSRKGELLKTFAGNGEAVNSVCFSRDRELLVSGSSDGKIQLWSQHGRLLKTISGHGEAVTSVEFSPDAQKFVSASASGEIKVWNREGELLESFVGHKEKVSAVSFSPDGKIFASASNDSTVKLWKTDGTLLKTLEGHDGRVWSVKFSADGQLIASASGDQTIKIWSANGTELQTIQHDGSKHWGDVDFSPNGQSIASASFNTVKLWSLDREKLRTLEKTLNDLDEFLEAGCTWLEDYIETGGIENEEKKLCD